VFERREILQKGAAQATERRAVGLLTLSVFRNQHDAKFIGFERPRVKIVRKHARVLTNLAK